MSLFIIVSERHTDGPSYSYFDNYRTDVVNRSYYDSYNDALKVAKSEATLDMLNFHAKTEKDYTIEEIVEGKSNNPEIQGFTIYEKNSDESKPDKLIETLTITKLKAGVIQHDND